MVSPADAPRLVFGCSRNLRRSLTAEHLLRRSPLCQVRSVGTASSARVQVRERDIEWADVVHAMEPHHVVQLRERFRSQLRGVEVVCLDIPDDHDYMDDDLVEAFEAALAEFFP